MALTKISRGLLNTGVSDSSDATAITIDSSERVMIGTTDPGYPDYGDSLTLGDVDGGGGNAGMTIRSGTSSYGTFYFSDATGTAAGTYAGKMQYNHSTNSMVFATNSSDRLTIDSSGNVGIGTTSPVATLQVKTQTNGNLAFQNSTSVTGGVKLNCFNDAANASSPFEIDGSSLQFNIAASEKMRIDSSGNVGIGITPTSKLTIFGTGAGNARVQIEGEGGADPYINFLANNAQHWSLGIDDSDSDKFKIAEHSALGTNDYFVVDTSGRVTMPYQPAFEATVGTSFSGDGSVAGTETFVFSLARVNVGSHYNTSTGIFTVPVTGLYQFNFFLAPGSSSQNHRYFRAQLVKTSGGTSDVIFAPHNTISDETDNADYNLVSGGGVVSLSANDTVKIQFGSSLATSNYTFYQDLCSFSGYLIG